MNSANSLFSSDLSTKDLAHVSFNHIINSYISYYASGSSHTARAKRLDLDHFLQFLKKHNGYSNIAKISLSDWDSSSVQRFVDDSLGKGEAPTTVARRLATIKHLGRTLSEKSKNFINPAKEVKTPKISPNTPKAISKTELKNILNKSKTRIDAKKSFSRYRNQVLFYFLLSTGLRADEVRLLKIGQIDSDLEWIKNVRTKGRNYRNVYMSTDLRDILKQYLARRTIELAKHFDKLTRTQDKELPLFISTYAATCKSPDSFLMGAKTIWRAINELSTESKLHPHLLRHSFAHELLSSSNDIRLVAQALGHSDVRITMRYTERKDHEIAEAIEKTNSLKIN